MQAGGVSGPRGDRFDDLEAQKAGEAEAAGRAAHGRRPEDPATLETLHHVLRLLGLAEVPR